MSSLIAYIHYNDPSKNTDKICFSTHCYQSKDCGANSVLMDLSSLSHWTTVNLTFKRCTLFVTNADLMTLERLLVRGRTWRGFSTRVLSLRVRKILRKEEEPTVSVAKIRKNETTALRIHMDISNSARLLTRCGRSFEEILRSKLATASQVINPCRTEDIDVTWGGGVKRALAAPSLPKFSQNSISVVFQLFA